MTGLPNGWALQSPNTPMDTPKGTCNCARICSMALTLPTVPCTLLSQTPSSPDLATIRTAMVQPTPLHKMLTSISSRHLPTMHNLPPPTNATPPKPDLASTTSRSPMRTTNLSPNFEDAPEQSQTHTNKNIVVENLFT